MRRMQNVDKHPKSGVYRVRLPFPKHLWAVLGAKSVTKSLGTKDAAIARRKAIPIIASLQITIERAEITWKTQVEGRTVEPLPSPQQGYELIERWRDDYLGHLVQVLTVGGTAPGYLALGDSPEDDSRILASDFNRVVELYYSGSTIPFEVQNRTLDRIMRAAGYSLPERHPLRSVLLGCLRSSVEQIRATENRWKRGEWTAADLVPAPHAAPPAAPAAAAPAAAVTKEERNTEIAKPSRPIRLSDLLDAHIKRTRPRPQSEKEHRLALQQLSNFLGKDDCFAHEITFSDAEKFYETLKWLPRSLKANERNKPIAEIAEAMRTGQLNRPRLAGATAYKKLVLLKATFSHAVARGHLSGGNPFERLASRRDSKAKIRRRPLTEKDLQTIFGSPLYMGCESYEKWRSPGDMLVANHRFWLPLLALATGARLEELGQLFVSDIKKSGDVLFLEITEEVANEDPALVGMKSLKTAGSTRKIPVHSLVTAAGFEDYWRWLESRGEKRLFPELPPVGKRTQGMSRWYNREFRTFLGLNDRSRPFHSFRHLFKDICRAAKLGRDLHDALTGHRDSSAGAKYGDGVRLVDLKEGIENLSFPGYIPVRPRRGAFKMVEGVGAVVDP